MIARNDETTALSKRTTTVQEEPTENLMQLPPWLKSLREGMASALQGDDLKEIMQAQVQKAKDGDMKAAQFVMAQAHKMVAAEQKRVTVIQNNFYDTPADERPDAPIEPEDDRQKRLRKLAARQAAGEPLAGRGGDRITRPVSDAEEKAMRRQEALEAEEAQ